MNSLESRIHAEAESTAAEIAAADIPPLRLRARRVHLPRRQAASPGIFGSGAAQTGARRWLIPLAAGASVAALAAALVAVGHEPGTRPRAATTPRPSASERRLLGTEALDLYVPATGAQYTAGLAFEWIRQKTLHQLLEPCLARAGFPQPAFSWSQRNYVLFFPDNVQFPDLAQRAQTRSMIPLGTGIHGQPGGKPSSASVAAMRRCAARYAKPITRLDRTAEPVQNAWFTIIGQIQSSARARGTQPAFRRCLQSHGIPARYANWGGTGLFGGFFAWMDTLGQRARSTQEVVAQQHRWTPVFVTCARPAVALMERLQLSRRAEFFRTHAGQVAAIMRLAAALPVTGPTAQPHDS